MNRIRLSINFFLDELVPPELYLQFGHKARWFIRKEVVDTLQLMRDRFGPVIVNNWSDSGRLTPQEFLALPEQKKKRKFTESGLRLFDTPTGKPFSLHKFGCAADAKFLKVPVEEVKGEIIKNYHLFKQSGMTTMEANTKGWIHFDVRNTCQKGLLIV